MEQQCNNCKYCQDDKYPDPDTVDYGYCVRYPPVVIDGMFRRVDTILDDWCGEWSPSEDYQESEQAEQEAKHIPEGWCQSCSRTSSCIEEPFVDEVECVSQCDKWIQKQE